jgi:hypothetical protein
VHLPLAELGHLRPFDVQVGDAGGEALLALLERGDLPVE